MRLKTIWTMPAASWQTRLARTGDWLAQMVAAHLPERVRYWVFVQVGGKAMGENDVVPDVRFMDLLARAEGGPR